MTSDLGTQPGGHWTCLSPAHFFFGGKQSFKQKPANLTSEAIQVDHFAVVCGCVSELLELIDPPGQDSAQDTDCLLHSGMSPRVQGANGWTRSRSNGGLPTESLQGSALVERCVYVNSGLDLLVSFGFPVRPTSP